MNLKSPVSAKLKDIDKSSAAVSFCVFPQNGNEEGFLDRFLEEDFEAVPVWLDRSGTVVDKEAKNCVLGAKFQVKVAKKAPVKKKATAKPAESKASE